MDALSAYKHEMEKELNEILSFWISHTPDHKNGGFVGKIDHNNSVFFNAPKGSVLNSRILWSFSAAFRLTDDNSYSTTAHRAFEYLLEFFIDKAHGGVYWTVDHEGQPLDTKKQIYALAFAVYGLSEYHRATGSEVSKEKAIALYHDIIRHSYDEEFGGYIEALSRDWKELPDLRLSAKDANEKKSMNTHLHVLEAFANLYRIWPDEKLKEKIRELLHLFFKHIISADNYHLILFFDENWNPKSQTISYGHDIEAAWLLQEAAEVIDDADLTEKLKHTSIALAKAASEGLDSDGGLWYEYEPATDHLIRQKHSWPQAEAMVGFFHAWQLTGDENYLQQSQDAWRFVKQHIKHKTGEWVWGVEEDYSIMSNEDKVGIWKCPYHNSRTCIEIIDRINRIKLEL